MEGVLSPPLGKRVVRLREYEEGDATVGGGSSEKDRSVKGVAAGEGDSPSLHATPPVLNERLTEFERRVKENLDVELRHPSHGSSDKGDDFGSASGIQQNWSKSSSLSASGGSGTSPLHPPLPPSASASLMNPELSRHSPGWSSTASSSSPSDLRSAAAVGGSSQPPNFAPFATPTSPTPRTQFSVHAAAGGSTGRGVGRKPAGGVTHSDSNEWTEFAYASVSGSSVEVGGVYNNSSSSSSSKKGNGEMLNSMSEFDPIRTRANSSLSGSSSTDSSKPLP